MGYFCQAHGEPYLVAFKCILFLKTCQSLEKDTHGIPVPLTEKEVGAKWPPDTA